MRSSIKELKNNAFLFETTSNPVIKRYQSCLEWYIRKACFYKKLYYVLISVAGICPLSVAAISGICSDGQEQIYIVLLSLAASVSSFLVSMFRAQEKWTEYRASAEYLKREGSKFLNEVSLKGADMEKIQSGFLAKIESYMADENREWKEGTNQWKSIGENMKVI